MFFQESSIEWIVRWSDVYRVKWHSLWCLKSSATKAKNEATKDLILKLNEMKISTWDIFWSFFNRFDENDFASQGSIQILKWFPVGALQSGKRPLLSHCRDEFSGLKSQCDMRRPILDQSSVQLTPLTIDKKYFLLCSVAWTGIQRETTWKNEIQMNRRQRTTDSSAVLAD